LKRASLVPFLSSRARKANSGGLVTWGWYLTTKKISAVIEATGIWLVDENLGWIGQLHRCTDAALGYGLRPQEAALMRGMVLADRRYNPHTASVSRLKEEVAVVAPQVLDVFRVVVVPQENSPTTEQVRIGVGVEFLGQFPVCPVSHLGTAPAADTLDDHGLRDLHSSSSSFPCGQV
jgi:hypothetical protein